MVNVSNDSTPHPRPLSPKRGKGSRDIKRGKGQPDRPSFSIVDWVKLLDLIGYVSNVILHGFSGMIATLLKLVLLIAVATSQMAGGGNCCCLWRSLGNLVLAYQSGSDETSEAEGVSTGCPNCCAKSQNPGKGEQRTAKFPSGCHADQTDQECQCVKSSVSSHHEGRGVTAVCSLEFVLAPLVRVASVDAPAVWTSYDKTLVLCGRNWNALACVWRL